MTTQPTALTIAMNLRTALAAAALGSTFNTYPNFGTRPVLAQYTDAARREDAGAAERYAAQWRELYPAQYKAWQAACVTTQNAADPSLFAGIRETAGGSVAFKCESDAEATLIMNAVNLYRHVLKASGIDPRNYAPATAEGAGFGWDAVQRAAGAMSAGSVTYMSRRMGEAIRLALLNKAEQTTDPQSRRLAEGLAHRTQSAQRYAAQR